MSKGSILVLGRNPIPRMERFCIDYDKPESTYEGKMFDGFGPEDVLPHKHSKDVVWKCYLAGVDFTVLQCDMEDTYGWPYVEHVLLEDNTWLEITGGEGHCEPDEILSGKYPGNLIAFLQSSPPETMISAFCCHF